LHEENGRLQYAETGKGEKIYGKNFISNIHPQNTLDLVKSDVIRKAYRERIKSLENSISVFCINAVMKKHTFPNHNQNYYYYTKDNPWSHMDYTEESWPMGFFMFASAAADAPEYCAGVSIMSCMRYDDVKKWEHTFNTDTNEASRGTDYDEFKKEKGEKLLSCTEDIFPGIRDCIKSWYASTPLSMRDYIGTSDGSLYGIAKDYKETMKTLISARTRIPNLLLTGQNLHMHGILGVAISSVVTCAELLGMEYLIEKIRNA
jgi:all-trans-retinol 13,14-reductase